MADTTVYGYSSPVVYHDGQGNQFHALIYSTRSDILAPNEQGELVSNVGPDGEPAATLLYLDPTKKPVGPQRGDMSTAILWAYDVPYLATEDLYKKGYNETWYEYPVADVVDPATQIADLQAQLTKLQQQISGGSNTGTQFAGQSSGTQLVSQVPAASAVPNPAPAPTTAAPIYDTGNPTTSANAASPAVADGSGTEKYAAGNWTLAGDGTDYPSEHYQKPATTAGVASSTATVASVG